MPLWEFEKKSEDKESQEIALILYTVEKDDEYGNWYHIFNPKIFYISLFLGQLEMQVHLSSIVWNKPNPFNKTKL